MNWHAVHAIYHFEMARMFRTTQASRASGRVDVLVVFGSANRARIQR